IAAVNVLAADSEEEARGQFATRRREFARGIFSRPGRRLDDAQVDAVLASPQGAMVDQMLQYTATGSPDAVAAYLTDLRALRHAGLGQCSLRRVPRDVCRHRTEHVLGVVVSWPSVRPERSFMRAVLVCRRRPTHGRLTGCGN